MAPPRPFFLPTKGRAELHHRALRLHLADGRRTLEPSVDGGGLRCSPQWRDGTGHLEDLFVLYRYFKECRNSIMHGGARATPNTVLASAGLATLVGRTTPPPPPFTIPQHRPVVLGQPVQVTLFGVVGFSDLLRRILLTVDAELSSSAHAGKILLARWAAAHKNVQLKAAQQARRRQLRRRLSALGLPRLPHVDELEKVLRAAHLVR